MTVYNEEEINLFNRYTNLLRDLVQKEQGAFDGIVLNSAKCFHCARICPSGIPRQLRDSDRVCCPACCRHRHLVPALTQEIHGSAGAKPITDRTDTKSLTAEVTRAMTAARKQRVAVAPDAAAVLKKLARSINNLKRALTPSMTIDEREARERIIAIGIASYRRMSGGLDPPDEETIQPDEVIP